MVPWFMRPIIYDVRARPNVITSTSGSKDLQMVSRAAASSQSLHEAAAGRDLTQAPILLLPLPPACLLGAAIGSRVGLRPRPQVNIGLRVLTRPMSEKLPEIYRTLGTDYAERVLPSIIQETLKSVIAQYNASQLLTMREVGELRLLLVVRLSIAHLGGWWSACVCTLAYPHMPGCESGWLAGRPAGWCMF
jgi:prohibitin 2